MRATRPSKSFRRAALVAGLALALVAMLALAPSARAGTYVAVQCHPDYDLAAANGVFSRTSDHYIPAAACSGAGLQITNNAEVTKDGRYGAWSWYPPAGTEFSAHHLRGPRLPRRRAQGLRHDHPTPPAASTGAGPRRGAGSRSSGAPAAPPSPTRPGCSARLGRNCGRSGAAHTYVRRLWFTLTGSLRPRRSRSAARCSSPARAGARRPPSWPRGDVGGGVWRWRLIVNGSPAGSAEAGCDIVPGGPARRFVPCPLSAAHAFALDTEAAPFRRRRQHRDRVRLRRRLARQRGLRHPPGDRGQRLPQLGPRAPPPRSTPPSPTGAPRRPPRRTAASRSAGRSRAATATASPTPRSACSRRWRAMAPRRRGARAPTTPAASATRPGGAPPGACASSSGTAASRSSAR